MCIVSNSVNSYYYRRTSKLVIFASLKLKKHSVLILYYNFLGSKSIQKASYCCLATYCIELWVYESSVWSKAPSLSKFHALYAFKIEIMIYVNHQYSFLIQMISVQLLSVYFILLTDNCVEKIISVSQLIFTHHSFLHQMF